MIIELLISFKAIFSLSESVKVLMYTIVYNMNKKSMIFSRIAWDDFLAETASNLQNGFLKLAGCDVYDLGMSLASAVFPLLFNIQVPVAQRHDFLDLPQAKLTGRDRTQEIALG